MSQGPVPAAVFGRQAGSTKQVQLATDASGNLKTVPASGTDPVTTTPAGFTPTNFAANNAGVAIGAAGAGVLGVVTVNTAGLTSTLTLYDGTSTGGTKIATISTLAQTSLTFNAKFTTGLFAVLAGGTAADVTISRT